jgi:hypothetical protein
MKYNTEATPRATVYIETRGLTVEVLQRETHAFIEARCCSSFAEYERYLAELNSRYGGLR